MRATYMGHIVLHGIISRQSNIWKVSCAPSILTVSLGAGGYNNVHVIVSHDLNTFDISNTEILN